MPLTCCRNWLHFLISLCLPRYMFSLEFQSCVMITVLILITISTAKCNSEKIKPNILRGGSTIQFNAVLDVTSTGVGLIGRNGLMMMAALNYTAKQVNDHDYLYGYKMGLHDVFPLSPWELDLMGFHEVVLETLIKSRSSAIIGPNTSGSTNEAVRTSATFGVTALSYSATYSYLDEVFSKHRTVRTVPSDTFRRQLLADMVRHWQWNHLGVIASYGEDGVSDALKFAEQIDKKGVCVQLQKLSGQASSREINASLTQLAENQIKVIILFTQIPDSYHVLKMIIKMNLVVHFHLVFFYGKAVVDTAFADQFRQVLVGAIAVDVAYEKNKEFKKHFLQTNLFKLKEWSKYRNNDWRKYYALFWQRIFQCNPFSPNVTNPYPDLLANQSVYCNGSESPDENIGYYPEIDVDKYIEAVYGYAYALRKEIEIRCDVKRHPELSKLSACTKMDSSERISYMYQLYRHFDGVTYRDGMLKKTVPWDTKNRDTVEYSIYNYVKKNDQFQSVVVGSWSMNRSSVQSYPDDVQTAYKSFKIDDSLIWWRHDYVGVAPNLRCSRDCPPGSITVYHKWPCCWNCYSCPQNNIIVNNRCVPCGLEEKISSDFRTCEKVPLRYDNLLERPCAIVLIGIACLLMLVLLGFSVFIYVHRDNPVMKASGKMLWYIIMGGLLLIPASVIPYLLIPSSAICVLRITTPSLAYLTIYAALFLKCYVIHSTFFGIKHEVVHRSHQIQNLIYFGIISCQLAIITALLLSHPSAPKVTLSKDKGHKYKFCSEDENPTALIISLIPGLLLLIAATVFAFKIRHYPHNHHETKSICCTLYISDVLWAVFLPFYYHSPVEGAYRQYEMSVFGIVVALVTLFGLFGQKVKIITRQSSNSTPPNDQSRCRNWSYMLKGSPGAGLNMDENMHDLKAYLDYHCPPRHPTITDDCEEFFKETNDDCEEKAKW